MGGLYCPPLIPAGIRQNRDNSRNSRGIKFGRGACQIDQMIPTEFQMEFKFCRNGSWNHPEGMNSWNATEWNHYHTHTMPSHAQIDPWRLLTINLGVVNNELLSMPHWFLQDSSHSCGIRWNPEESNLAETPAKIIFRGTNIPVEWCHSWLVTGMVPGMDKKECNRNAKTGI